MGSRSDNPLAMDFIWVGLSATLWRNPSLLYALGKVVAFVCACYAHEIMTVFSRSVSWWVLTYSTNLLLHWTSFAKSWLQILNVICYLSCLLLIVVCTGFYAEMFWDSFLYMHMYVCMYVIICKYTHIYDCICWLTTAEWYIAWGLFLCLFYS